jgi:hypothetical protein
VRRFALPKKDTEGVVDRILKGEFGYAYFDYDAIQTVDSIEHIFSTDGFIFGQTERCIREQYLQNE